MYTMERTLCVSYAGFEEEGKEGDVVGFVGGI